jgi:hypothetical protein
VGRLAVLAVLVSGGCSGGAPSGLGTGDPLAALPWAKLPPAKLPPELVAAWQKAGARVGWMRVSEFGTPMFLRDEAGKAGDVPAFQFRPWKRGVLANLLAPGVPFGLDLQDVSIITGVTNAGLKELAGLKSVHTLSLGGTRVTDAGLKELAGLQNLQSQDLFGTRVTHAGLQALAGLKSLHTLVLSQTQLTDAGAAALQQALAECQIIR